MRNIFLMLFFVLTLNLQSQSFYEQVMEVNIAIADSCNNPEILRQSADAFNRLLVGSPNDWPIAFHHTLCLTRIADLILKKDTASALSNYLLAKEALKRSDTLNIKQQENKILEAYLKIIELRFNKEKTRVNNIKLLETEIEELRKVAPSNPRLLSVYGYYYLIFYPLDKSKKPKTIELLKEACKHYAEQKPDGYYPAWGKKWNDELLLKVNIKNCVNKSGQK